MEDDDVADYNCVILVGRLRQDPELKYGLDDGEPYCRFSIIVNRFIPEKDGTNRKETAIVDVMALRHQAEMICQFLRKGSSVLVVGSLRSHEKEVDVVANRVQFLDKTTASGIPMPAVSRTVEDDEEESR